MSKKRNNKVKNKKKLDCVETKLEKNNKKNIDEDKIFNYQIQNFISILFTIIIFIALIMLIYVLYNKYIKKEEIVIDKNEVCQEFIKKDYGISIDNVENFIKLNRGIFYSIDNFDNINLNNEQLNTFITYYIWSLESDYILCQDDELNCLTSKKEISIDKLNIILKQYLNLDNPVYNFNINYQDEDVIRLYQEKNNIVLTFNEFQYQTYKHDILDITIDENNIKIVIALSSQIDNDNYKYVGSKIINLKYIDKNFVIDTIKTNINN